MFIVIMIMSVGTTSIVVLESINITNCLFRIILIYIVIFIVIFIYIVIFIVIFIVISNCNY